MRRRNKVAPRIPSFARVRTSPTDMPVFRATSLISTRSALAIFHSRYLLFQLCSHSGTRDATRVIFDENAVMASPVNEPRSHTDEPRMFGLLRPNRAASTDRMASDTSPGRSAWQDIESAGISHRGGEALS